MNIKNYYLHIKKVSDIYFKKENLKIWISGCFIIVMVGRIFFNSWIATIFLTPYLKIWYQEQSFNQLKKKEKKLKEEGKEFFESLMNCLSAGYSLEKSIPVIKKEMLMMYEKKESVLIQELSIMERKLNVNQSFEKVFSEFAEKHDNEEFRQFAFILKTAKRKGGNLIEILNQTIHTICLKNQAEEEITTVLAGRVFEKNIMKVIPFFIITYLKVFNYSYLQIMYETIPGRICMIVSLIAMVIAGKLADKIVDIEV